MRSIDVSNLAVLGLAIAAVLAPALAVRAADEAVIEEIVVTAQKRAESAQDIGISINAFSGDQLAAKGVATSEDIALYTPGLTVNETAATGVPTYTIRGVGFQDYSTAASSTVGLYFDEVSMPYTVMSRGAIFDIERVEVLKGPQGDLYGRNTTAGQINYISKLPTKDFQAGVKLGYSSFQTVDADGYVSGPLSDNLRGRLAFTTTQSSEGWQNSLTRNDKLGKKNVVAIRGMLDGDFGPVNALLRVQYIKDKSDNKANTAYDGREIGLAQFALPYKGLLPYIIAGTNPPWYKTGDNRAADWTNSYTDPNGVTYNLRPKRNNDLTSISLKLNWVLSDSVTLTSVTGYDKFKRNETNDWDGMPVNDSSNINTSDIKVFSQELRASGQGDKLNWVGGVYYSDDKVDEFYNYFMSDSLFGNGSVEFGIPPFVLSPILQLHTKYNQKTTSAAAFGHVEYKFTDALRMTAGLRYTDEKRRWSGCTFDAEDTPGNGPGTLASFTNVLFGTTLGRGACATIDDDPNSPNYIFGVIGTPNANNAFHVYDETIRAKKWMYKLGFDYHFTPDVMAYISYGRGFKSGGFNGANSNTTQQLKGYKPEQLDSVELGLKSSLADHRLQMNLAVFNYDYKNKQEQDLAVTFVGNISGLTNVPKSRIYGAEADLQWLPVKGLLFDFGAAWLHTRVSEWQAVSNTSVWPNVVRFDASGNELAQSPHWQLNGGVDYSHAMGSNLKFHAGMDANYKGSTAGSAGRIQDATDSYTVFNARVGVSNANDTWTVMLWSRNLFDRYYFPAAYQGGNGPWVRSAGIPHPLASPAHAVWGWVGGGGGGGGGGAPPPPRPAADAVFLHGAVYTQEAAQPWAQAVAVSKGLIVAVGSDAEVLAFAGPKTQRVELHGRMLMPGLIDAHVHAGDGAMAELFDCLFAPDATPEQIREILKKCVARTDQGAWITGGKWDSDFFNRFKLGSPRRWLDEIAQGHPILLWDDAFHNVWVNSAALAKAGVTATTADPPGGRFEREAGSREPNGVVIEAAAEGLKGVIPLRSAAQYRRGVLHAQELAHAFGMTGFKDADADATQVAAYTAADAAGLLSLYVAACIKTQTGSDSPDKLLDFDAIDAVHRAHQSPLVDTRFVKLFLDGVPTPARTAAMLAPYLPDAAGQRTPGMLHINPETLARDLIELDKRGYTVKMHAAGDRAIRVGLDAIAAARAAHPGSLLRHELAHAGYIDAADLPRFAQLNAVAELSPVIWYPSPIIDAVLSAVGERGRHYWPMRALLDLHTPMAAGSDWPSVVPSMDPWSGVESMVTRADPLHAASATLWPEQAITLAEALRIYTLGGAEALRREQETGSIKAGKSADFIVLDRNLFRVPVQQVSDVRVLATYFKGRKVYSRGH